MSELGRRGREKGPEAIAAAAASVCGAADVGRKTGGTVEFELEGVRE